MITYVEFVVAITLLQTRDDAIPLDSYDAHCFCACVCLFVCLTSYVCKYNFLSILRARPLVIGDSCHNFDRVCQQQTEEPLLDLGCGCRGELAKTHKSCIEIWFRTRGSNKCEICQ